MSREAAHGKPAGYFRWYAIKNRCNRPEAPDYHRYGGRGITLCKHWMVFANFIADVGQPPFKGAQLDRIDNDKGYEPGNVRWATASEQQLNSRTAVFVEVDGERLNWKAWAAKLGVSHQALSYRAKVLGSREAAVRSAMAIPMHKGNRWWGL
jgi:hypothetical protein